MSKPVILTGLRANSEFHIGNYLGGILPTVQLQHKHAGEYQVNMFVPDLHSFTTPIDHSKLYQQTIDNLRVFVAAGLDINNTDTYIYRQSFVPAHSELTWILDCFTGFGELSRMTQFKDKKKQQSDDYKETLNTPGSVFETPEDEKRFAEIDFGDERVSAGLFNYPVLMAADILLYGAKYIPVGEDQRQHLELTRDLAIRLNNKFNQELFVVPEPWDKQLAFAERDNGVRIRSLRNPEKKMSKSVSDPSGTIMLSDSPEEAAKKIMRAETDSFGEIRFDFKERPGISNLLQMLALLSGKPQAEVNAEWEGKDRYGDLKKAVAAIAETFLTDFQTKLASINEDTILTKLAKDEANMNQAAADTLLRIQKAVGLRK
jgi:tryptophanyl-tRNA synthetase